MKNSIIKAFLVAARMILCCTLLYAAIIKGHNFTKFVIDMKKSPILEPFNTNILGVSVIIVELLSAIFLCFKATGKIGLYMSFFIMLLFSGYLIVLYTNYPNAPCSCGGILGRLSYPVHIAFNILVTLLSVFAILLSGRPDSDTGSPKPVSL